MSDLGKKIRLNRLIDRKTGRTFMFAIDHGLSSPSFLSGLEDSRARVREAISGGANAILATRGLARLVSDEFRKDTAWALTISAVVTSSARETRVSLIGSVEEALRLSADAVALFMPLGGETESDVLNLAGEVSEACDQYGMPFILEAEYPAVYQNQGDMRGEKELGKEYLKHAVRVAAELGADLVEVNWPGDAETFAKLVQIASVPLVVAGGSPLPESSLLERIELAIKAGASGCCVGRNLFQHKNPEALARAISKVVHGGESSDQALKALRKIM